MLAVTAFRPSSALTWLQKRTRNGAKAKVSTKRNSKREPLATCRIRIIVSGNNSSSSNTAGSVEETNASLCVAPLSLRQLQQWRHINSRLQRSRAVGEPWPLLFLLHAARRGRLTGHHLIAVLADAPLLSNLHCMRLLLLSPFAFASLICNRSPTAFGNGIRLEAAPAKQNAALAVLASLECPFTRAPIARCRCGDTSRRRW